MKKRGKGNYHGGHGEQGEGTEVTIYQNVYRACAALGIPETLPKAHAIILRLLLSFYHKALIDGSQTSEVLTA